MPQLQHAFEPSQVAEQQQQLLLLQAQRMRNSHNERERAKMTIRIERRRGKEVIVISTVPSKRIQKAKARTRKRMLEIYKHFEGRVAGREGKEVK